MIYLVPLHNPFPVAELQGTISIDSGILI